MKIKLRLPDDRVAAVEAMLAGFEVTPKPEHPSSIEIRDPSDRWVLATAVAGGADVLVTGDQDLLAVQRQAPIPIVDPRAFWELLRARHTG
jgi:putative PIN family toxin of toxin-antitoxin system